MTTIDAIFARPGYRTKRVIRGDDRAGAMLALAEEMKRSAGHHRLVEFSIDGGEFVPFVPNNS